MTAPRITDGTGLPGPSEASALLPGLTKLDLLEMAEAIRRVGHESQLRPLERHHRIGGIIARTASSPDGLGREAMDRLARMLGHRVADLARFMRLARLVPDLHALRALVDRRSPSGRRLTWGHLTLILDHRDGAAWDELVSLVREQDLTVAELGREVRRRDAAERPTPRTLTGALANIDSMAARLTELLRWDFEERVAGPLAALSGTEVTADVTARVAATRQLLCALDVVSGRRAQELAAVEARLGEVLSRVAPPPATRVVVPVVTAPPLLIRPRRLRHRAAP